jgi:hypothetical protein
MVQGFRRFVYEHLGEPDIFLYVKPLNYTDSHQIQEDYLKMVKKYELVADVNYKVIKEKGGYSKCLDSASANWNHGWPGQPGGSEIHQYRGAQECGRMIREAEQERGSMYDRVILTRTDHLYKAVHPKMASLDRSHSYAPLGEDYYGINDRHTILTRGDANVRFKVHDDLMTGKYDCSRIDERGYKNAESFLDTVYKINNVRIKRYPSTRYLACVERRHCGNHTDKFRYPSEYEMFGSNQSKYGLGWATDELKARVERQIERCRT